MICPNCYEKSSEKNLLVKCPHCNFELIEDCKIKNIVVKNLFHKNDYEIDFFNEEKVSLLIGPNGFGKSVILNMIHFVYNPTERTFEKVVKVPFDSFTINFTNNGFVKFEKNECQAKIFELEKYNYTLKFELMPQKNKKVPEFNMYQYAQEALSYWSLENIKKNIFDNLKYILREQFKLKGFLFDFKELANSNHVIKDIINYHIFLQKLENLKQERGVSLDQEEAVKNYELFCKIYNERNKYSGKKMSNDLAKSFFTTEQDGDRVYSDGEKHDFYLFYYLICRTNPPNIDISDNFSLILIEEPETSLHFEWQRTWLDYVLKICKQKDVQVIVVTHSPFIVDGHFNLYANKRVYKSVKK